ncbi:MAG: EamA family transporter [Betaproteobacteria bacterium]|nr:EamA family transporter [Betaproteobacteria bacterium]
MEYEYLLILLAALAHAVWNTLVKGSKDPLLMLAMIRAVGLLMGILALFMVPGPALTSLPFLLGATAFLFTYYAFLLKAYGAGDLSQVYPIARGVAPLVVLALEMLFAGEVLSPSKLLAVLLICAGILVLAISRHAIQRDAVGYAAFTGLAIAGYTLLSGLGVRLAGSIIGFAAWLEILTGMGVLGVVAAQRRSAIADFVSSQLRMGLVAGLLSVGGYAIALWAMSKFPLATVAALRETSVVFAALIGTIRLRERLVLQRIGSACMVTAGVVLLAFFASG